MEFLLASHNASCIGILHVRTPPVPRSACRVLCTMQCMRTYLVCMRTWERVCVDIYSPRHQISTHKTTRPNSFRDLCRAATMNLKQADVKGRASAGYTD